jgi:hypothetical protein
MRIADLETKKNAEEEQEGESKKKHSQLENR